MVAYATYDLPPSVIDSNRPADNSLADAIRQTQQQRSAHIDSLAASMPGEHVSLRTVSFPAGAARKIGELLAFELEAALPFAPEKAVIDFQPVRITDEAVEVLAVAVQQTDLRSELETWQHLGAEPKELAAGAAVLEGLCPLVPELQHAESQLLVCLDSARADVCLVEQQRCVAARTILHGGGSQSPQHAWADLVQELRRTLTGWRATYGSAIQQLWLGGCARVDDSGIAALARELDITARLIPLPMAPGVNFETSTAFMRATALAGRSLIRGKRINLRKGEFEATNALTALSHHRRLFLRAAAAVGVSLVFFVAAQAISVTRHRNRLRDRLGAVSETFLGTATPDVAEAKMLLAAGRASGDPLPKFTGFDALDAISNAIPTEIKHDVQRVHIDLGEEGQDGRLELQGTVGSIAERDRIAGTLKSHACFHEVELGRTTQAPDARRSYKLEADLQCGARTADKDSKGKR